MSLFSSIWDDLRHNFRSGHMVQKLLLINIAIFVVVKVIHLGCNIYAGGEGGSMYLWNILNYFCIPGSGGELIRQPWSVFTSIFLHEGLFHVLGNMFWLWIFGTIVGDLIGDQRVLPIYLMGGLAGGLMYFLSAQFLPFVGLHALGASAAIMAFGGAALILSPDYPTSIFQIKIKYVVLIMVLLDLVSVSGMENTGGHAAHLGGFIFGVFYIYALRDGKDWAAPVNRLLDRLMRLFSRRSKPSAKRVVMDQSRPKRTTEAPKQQRPGSEQERIDAILDKIKQHGFENLTQEEKDFLYNASKK
jgi:membrane associated rhomboid family serine protease